MYSTEFAGKRTDAHNDKAINRKEVKPTNRKEAKTNQPEGSETNDLAKNILPRNQQSNNGSKRVEKVRECESREREKRLKGNDKTRYAPFFAENQQSTNTSHSIRPSYIEYRSPMADCSIGDRPDALEWPKPAMVGLSKKLVCRK